MPIYDVPNRVQRVFIINIESHGKCDQNMSNMASCIGELSILCTKNAAYMPDCNVQMVLMAVSIYNVCNSILTLLICQVPAYKEHSYAMSIFVVNNNISVSFIHKI